MKKNILTLIEFEKEFYRENLDKVRTDVGLIETRIKRKNIGKF